MKRKIKREMAKRKKKELPSFLTVQYYSLPFSDFSNQLFERGYKLESIHEIRHNYWKFFLNREYTQFEAKELIIQYYKTVLKEIEDIVSEQSIAYWHHIVRRFAPTKMTRERDSLTVTLVRSVVEIAIQKFGKTELCNRIALSSETDADEILGGYLNTEDLKFIIEILQEHPQLVLTDFGIEQLAKFYDLNKLSFEIWKCASSLRVIAKGGSIIPQEYPEMFTLLCEDETDKLINVYDKRIEKGGFDHSASGTMIKEHIRAEWKIKGTMFMPFYNTALNDSEIFIPFLQTFQKFKYPKILFNFVWLPFNFLEYYKNHKGFEEEFCRTHGVSLIDVIATIYTLLIRNSVKWSEGQNPSELLRSWQRAYTGPIILENILYDLNYFLPWTLKDLDIEDRKDEINFEGAIDFLTLDKGKISLLHNGPHAIFIPVWGNSFFIDFAWLSEILYNLFFRVNPSDQNFKGAILEEFLRNNKSPLPSGKLVADDQSEKQIDVSFDLGSKTLLILECKAIGRSIAYDGGDERAIEYRNNRLNDLINELDEKALWLANNPVGKNYDVRMYKKIMSIGITPFIEYIPTSDNKFWISDELPRVLTPQELDELINDRKVLQLLDNNENIHYINSQMS